MEAVTLAPDLPATPGAQVPARQPEATSPCSEDADAPEAQEGAPEARPGGASPAAAAPAPAPRPCEALGEPSRAHGLRGSPAPSPAGAPASSAERPPGQQLGAAPPGDAAAAEHQGELGQAGSPAQAKAQKRKPGAVRFNASHTNYDVVAAAAEARGWRVVKTEDKASQCNVHWIDDGAIGDWLGRVEPWMRINHFPGMNNALARKTRLARNMSRMQRLFPKEYQFLPPTWVLPDELGDLEKRFAEGKDGKAIYIVKPDHLCQGRGIFLTTDVERIRKSAADCREKDQLTVVQRYIARPMLIDGFKFDLRLYLLVCGQPKDGGGIDLRMLLFRDGLVRLCTTQYAPPTAETMNQRCMHLTNYAINKNSEDFEETEEASSGSKRSLSWFMDYIEEEFGAKERRKLWWKLMGLCVKTLLTVQPTLEAEYDRVFPKDWSGGQMGCRCFEILGVDVMLDAKRRPYLIEINHLPSFTCDAPIDEDVKGRLIEQTLDVTCGSLDAQDRCTYDSLARERRATGAASPPTAPAGRPTAVCGPPGSLAGADATAGPSLMDLPCYRDFERAYPPPEAATKLVAHCETIVGRVRELFRPVHAVKKPTEPRDAEVQKPPLPPGRPPRSSETQPQRASSKRSRSAPGPPRPPRRALPSIAAGTSSSLQRSRSMAPDGEESESLGPARIGSARASTRPSRVFLPLKSVQITL